MPIVFDVEQLSAARRAALKPYLEFLRVPALSCGLYVLAAGATDQQRPHSEDEIYYVLRGRAHMLVAEEDFDVRAGEIIFVPARVPHHFHSIEEELALLVVFAPPETE